KLKEYTGQGNLGYLPDEDDKTKRKESIVRWDTWWKAEGNAFLQKSDKVWAKGQIAPEDQKLALERWHDGNKALEDIAKKESDAQEKGVPLAAKERTEAYETAAYLFKQATEKDPTLVSARLSRAIILYEQLKQSKEAETELKAVVHRFAGEAKYPKVIANFHLAKIYELRGDWKMASNFHKAAVSLDEAFLDGFIGQGDCALEQALAWIPGSPAAGGAGGGNGGPKEPREAPKDPPAETPSDGGDKKDEKPIVAPDGTGKPTPPDPREDAIRARDKLLHEAMGAYRQALDVIAKKDEALRDAAGLTTGQSGEVEKFSQANLLATIRNSKESLTQAAASVYFRLGRVHLARCPDPKEHPEKAREERSEAVANFQAARKLQPDEERYRKAVEFWEEAEKKEPEGGNK
ncbi:hypothetical protein HY251_21845, partial [bacterium]|nr:hypothetical protein [bacterium]